MPITKDNCHEILKYHAPNETDIEIITELRNTAESFIMILLLTCPDCADRTAAIRHMRETLMAANQAVILHGQV